MTRFLIGYVHILLIVVVVGLVGWIVQLARSHWRVTPIGRHLMSFSISMLIWFGLLALLAFGVLPLWVYAVGITPLTAEILRRNWLLATGGDGTMPGLGAWISQRRKGITAALTAGLVAAQYGVPMSDTAHAWVAVALAVLGAGTVYGVRNAPKEPTA